MTRQNIPSLKINTETPSNRSAKKTMSPSNAARRQGYGGENKQSSDFVGIRATYVTCYTDSISFVDACKERGVDISW